MSFLYSLFGFAMAVLGSLLLLRAYLWTLAISPRDPMVRFAWQFTDWLVNPVAYVIRPRGAWDWSTLFAAFLVAVVQTLVMRELTGFPMTPEAFIATPFALMLRWAVDLMTWGLIIYCVMSFVSGPMNSYAAMLYTIVDPFLRPFRRFIPTVGRFDFSPIVLFILLSILERFILPVSQGLLMLP